MNNILFYGTARPRLWRPQGRAAAASTETKTECRLDRAALGMEVGFTPNWSAKVEYLYMDLGSRSFSITGIDNGLQRSLLRFGINYHF